MNENFFLKAQNFPLIIFDQHFSGILKKYIYIIATIFQATAFVKGNI